jgi:hypothetical protein
MRVLSDEFASPAEQELAMKASSSMAFIVLWPNSSQINSITASLFSIWTSIWCMMIQV